MRWLTFCLLFFPVAALAAIGAVVPVSVSPQFGAVPYTGFNSFYAVNGNVSQTYMQDVSDYIATTSGLQAAWGGDVLADIDENWTATSGSTVVRDGGGHVVPSVNFTSMPALTAHIKANGQIPGIYRDGGQIGCALEDWGGGTLLSDITYWFQTWGFQAVKVDGCGFFTRPGPLPVLLSGRTVYGSVDTMLKGFGAPFLDLYGYSSYLPRPYTQAWAYGPRMGSAAWRYSADDGSVVCGQTFPNVLNNARVAVQHIGTTGPGHVNDADYLGANNNALNGTLSTNEAITQMALAALLSSPWVLGCDPRNLGATELAALKNADMIAALKDSWVHAGTRLDGASSPQIWEMYCKHLNTSGKRFIVAVNEDPAAQTITVDPSLCGITGSYTLKNVLTGSTSSTSGTFSTGSLASHASGVYLLTSGTESNATCWATNPGGTGQIADGFPNGCAFTADNNGNPAGGFAKDGTTATTATPITTAGLTNPAAAGCYQNQRKGVIEDDPNEAAIEYLADNLVVGATYHYRIHLAEIEGKTTGQRLWNLTINTGAQSVAALTSEDIYADAGNVANKAVIKEGNVVADHGYLSFDFEPSATPVGVPTMGCIEVIKQ